MNLRTTLVLGILLLIGAGGWVVFMLKRPKTTESETVAFLETLTPKSMQRIEINDLILTHADNGWRLPGNWPLREQEVDDLVKTLSTLGSRYLPLRLPDDAKDKALKGYGLDKPALKVVVQVDGKNHTLAFGQALDGAGAGFSRPTYLRLDDKDEVIRLGPNLIARLDRPQRKYQKLQLFPSERVVKDEKSREKVDSLLAKEIQIAGPQDAVVDLVKAGDAWELRAPRDRVDAEKIKALLTKAPDIWAESFDAEAIKKKFESWPPPLTGLAPAVAKRDFYTSQALWSGAQVVLAGAGEANLGALAFGPVSTGSLLVSQALPDYVLKVTRPDGVSLTLYVGGVVSESSRKVPKTINIPGKGPITIQEDVSEQRRCARVGDAGGGRALADMPLFEVKGDLLKELPTSLDALRDAALIRFEPENARTLEIQERKGDDKKTTYETTLVFAKAPQEVKEETKDDKKDEDPLDPFRKDDPFKKKDEKKEKEVWRMRLPSEQAVEREPLQDLLRELSRLETRDEAAYPRDAELARYGLDKPAFKVKLSYEEEPKDKKKKGKDDKKVTREATLLIGARVAPKASKDKKHKDDKDKDDKEREEKKVWVSVEGWPRVSAVDEKVLELVSRPAHVYRGRQVLDLASGSIDKLEVERPKDAFVLVREKGEPGGVSPRSWKLEAPVKAEAADKTVEGLLKELGRLEAAEFVADRPSKEDLEKKYGLAPPQVSVKVRVEAKKDDKKTEKTHVVQLGKQRPDRPDFYARVDDGPVFVLKKEAADALLKDSLAYRALPLWRLKLGEIAEIDVEGKEAPYRLIADKDKKWKIAGPIEAFAGREAGTFVSDLAELRAVRFVDQLGKDVDKFGLKTPTLKVTLKLSDKKEKRLLVGGPVETNPKERYARIADEPGVFVLAPDVLSDLERTAYDWLDKVLLTLNPAQIQSVEAAGKAAFTLKKKSGEWEVVKSPAPTFTAEDPAVQAFLRPWMSLQAERVAATGSKIDYAKFGLDKPYLTLTVNENLPDGKPIQHVLALGGDAGKGERYARMDKSDFVAVLAPEVVKALDKGHVDFLPLQVMKYTIGDLTGLVRSMPGGADIAITKAGDSWRLDKPYSRAADEAVIGEIGDRTFRLRAARIAAYPAKDLAPFGLDKPAATWKFQIADPTGAPSEETLLIGLPAGKDTDERYAMKAKDDKVFVLPADLARTLLARPLAFADRNLTTFTRADQAIQETGKRRAVFTKAGSDWKMTSPVEAKAEDAELESFVKDLTRFRAGELVDAKPADLKKYGLEKPETVWTFRLGDKQVMKLLVGAVESAKDKEPRRYAKIDGNDTVFLLAPRTTQQALAEYRDRKVLEGFDAVKAEQIIFKSPAGTYKLRKSDTTWTLLEEPDKKVNAKVVTETLDALAGLKAAHYLTDTADAEQEVLTGLQKAEWTIELRSEKETFVLSVGRQVAGGKDRYAKTASGPALFILREADLEKILRPSTAFVAAGKSEEKK